MASTDILLNSTPSTVASAKSLSGRLPISGQHFHTSRSVKGAGRAAWWPSFHQSLDGDPRLLPGAWAVLISTLCMPRRVSSASGRNTRPCCWHLTVKYLGEGTACLSCCHSRIGPCQGVCHSHTQGTIRHASAGWGHFKAAVPGRWRPFYKQVVTGKGHFSDSSCSPPSCS